MNLHLSNTEFFLLLVAGWLLCWLCNSFVASLLSVVVATVMLAVLCIAAVAEWVEPSRVPRRFFTRLCLSVAADFTASLVWWWIFKGLTF